MATFGEHGILEVVMAAHAGMTSEAEAKGWTVIDVKSDWKVDYPFELERPPPAMKRSLVDHRPVDFIAMKIKHQVNLAGCIARGR